MSDGSADKPHVETEVMDPERRAALRAIAKYAGAAGGMATLTVLSAEQAVAQQPCSFFENDNNGQVPERCRPTSGGTTSQSTTDTQLFQSDTIFNGDGTQSDPNTR